MENKVEFHALFEMFNAWAAASPRGFRSGGGVSDGVDHIQLHFRPDPRGPETQLTLRAELRDGRPVICAYRSPAPEGTAEPQSKRGGSEIVGYVEVSHEDEARGREPDAVCEGCGMVGTVGRATRTDDTGTPIEVHRFCLACWPEQSARYRARWEEEDRHSRDEFLRHRGSQALGPRRGMTFEAATWHGTLDLVRTIERAMSTSTPPAIADLERLVAEIRRVAPELEGEMPFAVEGFLRRYGPPA